MSNERYLIISYFGFAALCLGLGVLIAQILRKPFEAIVDATVGARNKLVKRTMTATLISAGVLGFLGYSYNQKGCISYQQVIQNRQTLVDANVHQVQGASHWIVFTVIVWGLVVVLCLKAVAKHRSGN